MRIRAILTGHKEAMAGLRALGKAGPAVMRRVVPGAGEEVAARARELVPVKTGRAQRSIRTTRGIASAVGRFSIAVVAGGQSPAEWYVPSLHENVLLPHPHGGQAKFIEVPFLQIAEQVPERLLREVAKEAPIAR